MKATFISSVSYKFFTAIAIIAMVLATLPVQTAQAASTGFASPTSCASATWTIPANALTSNDVQTTAGGDGNTIVCTFNLPVIPAGNVIYGIEVTVEGSGTTTRDVTVDLSWDAGGTFTGGDPTIDLGGTEQIFTEGGSTDTWGRPWAVGDFTAANFRVRLTNDNDTGTSSIDHIQVNVHYDLPPEMNVQGNSVSIADGDATPAAADFTDFGNVPENFFVDRTFTIQNTGTGPLSIGAITFTGGDTGDFSVVTPPAATVAPSGSTTFTVRLTANGGGAATRDTTINIVNNDANENPYNFAVQGTRINAEINVQGLGNSITDGDGTPNAADCTNFGNVQVGNFVDCTYTIQNLGPAAANVLSVGTVTLGGADAADFSVTVQPTSPIANGGSTTFTVRFTPSTTGARNATVSFVNNDTGESPYNWSIQGTGTVPSEINVQGNGVSIADGDTTPTAADFTDFGNVPENLFVDRTFTIQNTGTADLAIGAISFTGGDAGDFSVVASPAATVIPGGSTTFTVRLTSGGGGTRNTTINIVNNDTNENPYNFDVQGTNINAEINVQGNAVNIADGDGTPNAADCTNFGSVVVFGFIDCTYTIQNLGPAAANVLSVGTVTLGGANAADFSVTVQPTSPIAFPGSTTFTVRFTPSATGARNATISFINNDGGESPYNWSIQGTGLANTAPTITSNGGGATANINVAENTTAVTTVTATDPNVPPQTLTYSTSGTDAGDFSIVPATGVLTFSPAPNFEVPADADVNNSYIVIVQASDGAGTDTQTITVNVTNVNEPPTDIALSANSIAENNAVNDVIGALSTTDPDAGNTFTYSLACAAPGSDDGSFNIGGANLQADTVFDFETQNSFSICIRTTDQGGLFFDENFTITITDVDEIPPVTSIDSTTPSTTPTNSTAMDITFSSNEGGSTFQCQLDAGTYASCTSPANLTGLSDGSHTFSVYATDPAGNDDLTPASFTWTVDTTTPDTSITANPSNPSNNNNPTFSFTGNDGSGSGVASFQCQIDGGGFAACTSGSSFGLFPDGTHTFEVRAIDNTNNTDPTPASFTWIVDTTEPDTTITSNPSNPSNDNNPTFSFTGDDGSGSGIAGFQCQIDSGGFSACTSGSAFGPLADGSHTFEVRSVDNANNIDPTPASFTWTVDTTAPDTNITANPTNPSNNNNPTFSFTGNDGGGSGIASFECRIDGGGFAPCISGSTFGPLVDGSHTFEVRAIDNANNIDPTPASFTWTVDTSEPDTSITANPVNPTNSTSASFSFTGNDGTGSGIAGFECNLDAGGFTACTNPQNYAGLSDGSHTFQVRAIDNAGNTDSTPASFTWTVDTGEPDTSITSNPSNPTNSTSASFSFTGNDGTGSGIAGFECDLDGSGFTSCTNPQNYAGLSDGSHTFQVRAIDNAGNVDLTAASFTWTIDTTAPDTNITANPVNPTNDNSPTFSFTGSDGGSGIASFECQMDGGGFSACATPATFGLLADGSHTFEVRAVDNTGNPDATPASFSWTIDTTAPDTTITGNPATPTNDNTPTFTFNGSDPGGSGIASFQCRMDAGVFTACTSPATFGPVTDGSHTFEVRAIDNAGNPDTTPASYTWVTDATSPDTTITANPTNPSNDNTPTFSITGNDGSGSGIAGFECQMDGGGFSACTSGSTFGPLVDGSHTFQVRAMDGAGNTDATPASFTWLVDTTAPDTTITANPTNPDNDNTPTFLFTGNDSGGSGIAGFECQMDGGGFSACASGSTFGPLVDGSHTFEVRAVDNVNNLDPTPASFTWQVDTTEPDTTITANPTNPSNDNTPTFSFTGNDGSGSGIAGFECQMNGGGFSACTSGSTFGPLVDGSHIFEVRTLDNLGNTDSSPASFTWTIDTTAPDTNITANPSNPSNDNTPAFSFTGNDIGGSGIAGFECQIDGGGFSACTSGSTFGPLADGSHTFEVRAIDNAGNTDPTPASFTWIIDATAPDTTITANPGNPSNTIIPSFSFTGNDGGGTGINGFECQIDGAGFSACTSGSSFGPLADGSHTFQVRAIDNSNNTDPTPASFTWLVDTTAPNTTITTNPPDPDNDTTPSFSFTGNDGGGSGIAGFECQMDGGGFSACTSGSSFGPLADGSHTFEVRAIDNLNQTDTTPASYSWTVDTTAPDTSITSTPPDPDNNDTPAFSFTSPDGSATFECQMDSGGFSPCTSGSSFGSLADGSHTFEVRAVDTTGNTDPSPASYTWLLDTTEPDTTITANPADPDSDNTPAFSFTGNDAGGSGIASFECQMDGGGFSACTSGSSFGPLADGLHTFEVRAIDNLNQTDPTSASYTWVVDTTLPDTIINSNPTNPANLVDATFTFSSPDIDVVAFECQMDGGGFSACTSPQNYPGLSGGGHTFAVRAIDSANNVDSSPATYSWLVDLGFPTVLFTANTIPANNSTITTGPTQIQVEFSEDVKNDGSAGAANNSANYLLVEDGANNTFDTVSCVAGLVSDDTQIVVDTVIYTNTGGSGPYVATLGINGAVPLPIGNYRLFICGTTSIEDLAGNELNNGASDSTITFTVARRGGGGNNGGNTLTGNGLLIPVTGFPQGEITNLALQSLDKAYAATDLWMEIPRLGLKISIVGVPQTRDGWDVSWLGRNAGWLNGSAFPTWNGNSVITAHVWDALNKPGPFAGLINLQYGDQVKVHAFGQVYIYEITGSSLISASNTSAAFKHEEKSWLTLITCEGYNEKTNTYSQRRMVRAVLVRIEKEK